jgi:hypothetical protein
MEILIFLCLLYVKHYLADFVLQTERMVKEKGIYLANGGIDHSGIHALFTFIISFFFFGFYLAILFSIIDFITHYHIDWFKMNFGNRDITNRLFWNHLGLDQLSHNLVYILISFLALEFDGIFHLSVL